MISGTLLGRVLLHLPVADEGDLGRQLSAAALAPDGMLWVAGDESSGAAHAAVTRLAPATPTTFADARACPLDGIIDLFNPDDEADFEGLAIDGGYLWFTGSHSLKRRKPKGKSAKKDIERLSEIVTEGNRYLLGRVPIAGGLPARTSGSGTAALNAARLTGEGSGNALTKALREDDHLGSFLAAPLAAKENGFDIEGLAVRDGRVFVGLRGPVLNGVAVILELAFGEAPEAPGRLRLLKPAAGGSGVRKYFLDLNGLGVRDLAFAADGRLLILAGATMTVDAPAAVYGLDLPAVQSAGSEPVLVRQRVAAPAASPLTRLFTLPIVEGADKAEALMPMSWHDQPAVLVAFDGPAPARIVDGVGVYADVYALV